MHVEAPVRHAGPIQGPDYDFLAGVVAKTPKVCIPAPSMLHFRGGRQAISQKVYPDLEDFYADLAAAYRAEIADLATRGCRYLQMDDRSEEHTSELQSLMRISYAVFCLKKNKLTSTHMSR